jgi:UDP-N-acetyl-D-glucosamine dehydrogenase
MTVTKEQLRAATLLSRIEGRSATVGVIGLGYVGLPLAAAAMRSGFSVIGFDVDRMKIDKLEAGRRRERRRPLRPHGGGTVCGDR